MKTVFILFITFSQFAQAALLTVITDQKDAIAAKASVDLIKKTAPFSRMPNLKIEIKQLTNLPCNFETSTVASMTKGKSLPDSCKSPESQQQTNNNLKRSIVCNNPKAFATIKAQTNSDYLLVIRDNPNHGGTASGDIAIFNSGSALVTGLHEFLHMLGLADEYSFYSVCETDMKCNLEQSFYFKKNGYTSSPHSASNVTIFADAPPYASDAEARALHAGMIPWYSQILPTTRITAGTALGTPNSNVIGLFQADDCKLATDKAIKSWRSGSVANVMQSLDTNFVPKSSWKAISAALNEPIQPEPHDKEVVYNSVLRNGKRVDEFEVVFKVQSSNTKPTKTETVNQSR